MHHKLDAIVQVAQRHVWARVRKLVEVAVWERVPTRVTLLVIMDVRVVQERVRGHVATHVQMAVNLQILNPIQYNGRKNNSLYSNKRLPAVLQILLSRSEESQRGNGLFCCTASN